MKKRTIVISLLVLAVGLALYVWWPAKPRVGNSTPRVVPPPPTATNAVLKGNAPIYFNNPDKKQQIAVRLLACCNTVTLYATKTEGDYSHHWCVVSAGILKVESGVWAARQLSFIFCDSWPTKESGIMANRAPAPYWPGNVLSFDLDASSPPVIVAQQDRSLLPPHNMRKALMDAPLAAASAVFAFRKKAGLPPSALESVEETASSYIYGTGSFDPAAIRTHYQVDKGTLTVTIVPAVTKATGQTTQQAQASNDPAGETTPEGEQ